VRPCSGTNQDKPNAPTDLHFVSHRLASFCYDPYHRPTDLPDTLDYRAMSELVRGLAGALVTVDEHR
jgi:hypothetical protein